MSYEAGYQRLQGWRKKMSKTRYKLHWITAIIEVLKTVKEAILPIIVLVFANGSE